MGSFEWKKIQNDYERWNIQLSIWNLDIHILIDVNSFIHILFDVNSFIHISIDVNSFIHILIDVDSFIYVLFFVIQSFT